MLRTNKQISKETKKKKRNKVETYYVNRIKKIEAERLELEFLGTSMRVHTQGLHMQPSCMRTHTLSMRMHTCPNPNPENREQSRTKT